MNIESISNRQIMKSNELVEIMRILIKKSLVPHLLLFVIKDQFKRKLNTVHFWIGHNWASIDSDLSVPFNLIF